MKRDVYSLADRSVIYVLMPKACCIYTWCIYVTSHISLLKPSSKVSNIPKVENFLSGSIELGMLGTFSIIMHKIVL